MLVANKVQVQPYFVVATLISWTEAQGLAVNCEGSVQTNLPFVIRVREVDKTTHIGPFTRHCSYNGVGPGGTGKSVGKGFFDNTGGLTAVTI